ncbi:tyrosine-type recombinase/integrase [Methylobacterium sp. J-043]|nr:tyrosine-type recombinase/integrase [Methylobacterium sp. J-043]
MRPPGRPGNYVFLPPKSTVYHIRFQYPATDSHPKAEKVVMSLGTRDHREAIRKSQSFIDAHIAALAERKRGPATSEKRAQMTIQRQRYNLGVNILEDGRCVIVAQDNPTVAEIVDKTGKRTFEANVVDEPIPGATISEPEYWAAIEVDQLVVEDPETGLDIDADCPEWRDRAKAKKEVRPPVVKRGDDPDLELLELWVKNQSVTPHIEREARLVFETFKRLTNNKRFEQCGYVDGVALADHLFLTNRWPTVRKKVGHMRAIVNFAEKRGLFDGRNPFANVMRKERPGDIRKRFALTDDDMKLMRDLGPTLLKADEWLLWVLLATTGMRLSEAIQISGERVEKGIRYIEIADGKTAQSQRRVPLPKDVLPLLPPKITGRMFSGRTIPAWSKHLNRMMNTIGIEDTSKVVHSLRHRAKDRLRAEGVGIVDQYEILGHEKKTVAAGYGHGSPLTLLKPMIDRIGY